MGKRVLIVQNITREGPGLLATVLGERGIAYDICDLDGEQEILSPVGYGAMIVLGGPDSANDGNAKMQSELKRIREALAEHIPFFGICLGLQALVKAGGGNVVKNHTKEIGFRDPGGDKFTVELTEKGKHDPLFTGLGHTLTVFQLHGETVEITDTMQLLATGKYCRNQIVRVAPRAYGIQCHFELTPDMLEAWIENDEDLRSLDGGKLRADFAAAQEVYTRTGERLFRNFLDIAGL